MTNWTGLLESLHSALIDEITERMSGDSFKPELGMPTRLAGWELPTREASTTLLSEASFGEAKGLVAICFEQEFVRGLKCTDQEIWDGILRRAGSEFMRRKIQPRLIPPSQLGQAGLPKNYHQPARLVWIPLRIRAYSCYLGLGV